MDPHPDQQYIDAILRNDPGLLRQVIEDCYPPVEAWICRNGGTVKDAEDVFGDAMEAICSKLFRGEQIEIRSRFSTFIFSICRYKWFNQLRRRKIDTWVRIDDPEVLTIITNTFEEVEDISGLVNFARGKLNLMGDSCRRLLELCWSEKKLSMEEIAHEMGFASANYASKRKHECIAKLKEILRADPGLEDYL